MACTIADGVTPDVRSARGREACEPGFEVGAQVVDVLKTDMEAQRRALGAPLRRRAIAARIERDDEALVAAPREAHAEQLKPVEHRGDGGCWHRLQDHREEPGGAEEIALPDRVLRVAREAGMEDARDLGALLQPARDLEPGALVLGEAALRACAGRAAPG